MNRIELLAPARDLATGRVAINCGADAVYIGAARFGARQAVGNSLADIEKLVVYAHKYWARVYAVVNTLLYDDELDDAVQLTHQLHRVGVDALIIQDVGLLECDLPSLPLYASTQMHNHTPERVAFLEMVGFQRVILARELSFKQIRAIRAATHIELETFIHGALCVSYSGQCYLSYALGGRSGNRGQCAQPCRCRYSLVDAVDRILAKNRYLLSLKDLNLTDYLRKMLEVGVTSFKIEGRLKGAEYVANLVGHYRRQLDVLLPDLGMCPASSGQTQFDFEPDPVKTFNRGYTPYFVTGRRPDLVSFDTPKHIGEPLGRVVALYDDSFTLETVADLHNGDGIAFFDKMGKLQGTRINRVDGPRIYPASMVGIAHGMWLYRNHDHVFIQRLTNAETRRKIAVRLCFTETLDGFCLLAKDEDDNLTQETLICEKRLAQKREKALQTLRHQLMRFGGTDFVCADLEITLSNSYFLPIAKINALRRKVLENLSKVRQQNFPHLSSSIIPNKEPFPQTELTFEGNVLNHKAIAFYRRHGVSHIQPAAESGLDLHGKRVMVTKFCLKYQLEACPCEESHQDSLPEILFLVNDNGQRLRLAFDCSQCVMEIYLE